MTLTIQTAEAILKPFVCTQGKTIESKEERQQIQQSLLLLAAASDYQTLGICAASPAEAMQALCSYLKALGHSEQPTVEELPAIPGGVYLKFNTQRQSLYWDTYTGQYRGVLVTCQSQTPSGVSGTYGHLPLDLFED